MLLQKICWHKYRANFAANLTFNIKRGRNGISEQDIDEGERMSIFVRAQVFYGRL